MSIIKDAIDAKATRHESNGGTCKTISIGGKEIKVCLDEDGKIKEEAFRNFAKITNQ
jgi:hypothetical protein